ncbi:hypothetical protein EV283_0634 [Sphingomonas sp. BK036]|uniref:hypothetical protein n=1 Tax=Sphingomonas sp. BK036 TaxID=2512122 RepID=UPI0010F0E039|nr:hypothetical protein [Sphingomonas sp. BK036]RZT56581.1 hypothetical protein EV283_0634 [Sphingomonas sp. BK036]
MIRAPVLAAVALMLVAGKSDPLAGRIAGTPVRCITLQQLNGPEIVDSQTILYRQSGKRIWKTGPVGECASLRPFDTMIVDVYGGQLCRNDRFRTVSNGMSIPSGYCRFRDFTPYDKVK